VFVVLTHSALPCPASRSILSMSQPVPPAFKDIGKTASDLLGKDYPIGSTRLEVKTKASNGVVSAGGGICRHPRRPADALSLPL